MLGIITLLSLIKKGSQMSKMSELNAEINHYLDNTRFMIDEIANAVGCPVEMVNTVVEERWENIMKGARNEVFENA
jgi:predicted XRE-type DNA-binding protein